MPSTYTFSAYCADWPHEFEQEAERLRTLLGDELISIHHIGSTSVAGLAAKPVIDLLPVVRDMAAIDAQTREIEHAGYQAWGENGIARRRLFTKDDDGRRTHNIHMFPVGAEEIERHLAFCAYLRHERELRGQYADLKRRVYAEHPADIAAYSAGKNAWIKQVEAQALRWYRARPLQPPEASL